MLLLRPSLGYQGVPDQLFGKLMLFNYIG